MVPCTAAEEGVFYHTWHAACPAMARVLSVPRSRAALTPRPPYAPSYYYRLPIIRPDDKSSGYRLRPMNGALVGRAMVVQGMPHGEYLDNKPSRSLYRLTVVKYRGYERLTSPFQGAQPIARRFIVGSENRQRSRFVDVYEGGGWDRAWRRVALK